MSRTFGFIALIIAVAIGMYIYVKQTQAVSPAGIEGAAASPRATIDLAGVKQDMLQFGRAERQHLASEGKYLTLDELRAGGDTGLPANSRGPFQYSIEASGDTFTVTATYTGAPVEGVPKVMRMGPEMNIQSE